MPQWSKALVCTTVVHSMIDREGPGAGGRAVGSSFLGRSAMAHRAVAGPLHGLLVQALEIQASEHRQQRGSTSLVYLAHLGGGEHLLGIR